MLGCDIRESVEELCSEFNGTNANLSRVRDIVSGVITYAALC